eukprot:TRINITY_DN19949_c0_g1_i1.p1 TRINITY_DN19949_c0_g1~~TRINITY_DN19949_c0_g1_i1.p1  ORF type:complete len:357 (+),score=82.42 TRINITY_DN19949_c0_g1_i1:57-1127(+)
MSEHTVRDSVKEYYGKVLSKSADLKTNACTSFSSIPKHIRDALRQVHEEVIDKFYGCGLVAPSCIEGSHILDLGSGSGRDCYVLAKLAGPNGRVVGIDMTDEQIQVARKHIDYHAQQFGFPKPTTEFIQGYIERLDEAGLADNSFDIVVSNCVVNLSPDKEAVLRHAYRVLRNGGEMYFSDVYADRRVPSELVADPVLFGECLSGALYWNDFMHLARKVGFADVRLVESHPISISNPKIEELIGHIRFYSATYRLFKLPSLEFDCEDYGQAVRYKGTVEHCPKQFVLDNHHVFETGRIYTVCGNTYDMLNLTRFKDHFDFFGDRSTHFGIFPDCGKNIPFNDGDSSCKPSSSGGCC